MKEPVDRVPPYVGELLAAERAAPPPSRAAEARVYRRVVVTVGAATATGAATTAAAAKDAGGGVLASFAAKATIVAVVATSAGATGVIAFRRHAETTPPRVAARADVGRARAVAPARDEANVVSPVAPPAALANTLAPDPRARRSGPPAAARGPSSEDGAQLASESALVESARGALAAHDLARALALLEQHARLHRDGQLMEEREALWVRALAAKGDGTAARARAAELARRFPHSIQLDVVSAVLEEIP
jgi:hypothetical protein